MPAEILLTPSDDLQAAFDCAPAASTVLLEPGVYRQKAVIRTPNLRIRGAGTDKTAIVWDDYALKIHADGKEYNTFRTYTLAVCADDITMEGLSVVNDAGHPESKGQEVALSVLGNRFTMKDCRLSSTQDTLFAGPLPPDLIERYRGFLMDELRACGPCVQTYTNCLIEGSVDFIFGCADARFECCEIRSVFDIRQVGYVAAPAHTIDQSKGLHFSRCRFTCDRGVNPESIYLARPWRDHGLVIFENCSYGPHIAPEGFDKWNDTNRDKTARFYESPPVAGRVPWVRSMK